MPLCNIGNNYLYQQLKLQNIFILFTSLLCIAPSSIKLQTLKRTSGIGHHFTTTVLIPNFLRKSRQDDADYLDACRMKRNTLEYDCVGGITEKEVKELRKFVFELKKEVTSWLSENHPELL